MKEQLPVLTVRMFGRVVITYGGSPIAFHRQSMTRVQRLLLILLYAGEKGIARNQLIANLYGREEIVDVANNLRVTAHRLKRLLAEEGLPEYDYVVVKNGIYYWNGPMEAEVDALRFRELIAQADEMPGSVEKVRVLMRACNMYVGEFLEDLSGEEWVAAESAAYKKSYEENLLWLCDFLKEKGEYQTVLRLCEPACEIYPYDEWQAVRIDCYIALNKHRKAFQEYKKTEQMLLEELGATPSERMLQQLESIRAGLSGKMRVITEIREKLKGKDNGNEAYYCSLLSFQDAYCFTRRLVGKSIRSLYLMLCTITDGKGYPQEDKERLEVMGKELYGALATGLRKWDIFTKFNSSQFLALVIDVDMEGCEQIFEKILHNFSKEHRAWENYLSCDAFSAVETGEEPRNMGGGWKVIPLR